MTTTSHQGNTPATDTSTERTQPVTDTHQSTSSTLTHPDLPGAVFQPRHDIDEQNTVYWCAHLFKSAPIFQGSALVCETIYEAPAPAPYYVVDAPDMRGGMSLEQLHEFVATINAYYAAVTRDRVHNPNTSQRKGA